MEVNLSADTNLASIIKNASSPLKVIPLSKIKFSGTLQAADN
jgi:hypothetical protein